MKKLLMLCLIGVCGGCVSYGHYPRFFAGGLTHSFVSTDGKGEGYNFIYGSNIESTEVGESIRFASTKYDERIVYRLGFDISLVDCSKKLGGHYFNSIGTMLHFSDKGDFALGLSGGAGYYCSPQGLSRLGVMLLVSFDFWMGTRKNDFGLGVDGNFSYLLTYKF